MENLTVLLKDINWVREHTEVEVKPEENKFNIKLHHFYLLPELCKESSNGANNSIYVFVDERTDKLYKLHHIDGVDVLERYLLFKIISTLELAIPKGLNLSFQMLSMNINFDTIRIRARDEYLLGFLSGLEGASIIPNKNSSLLKFVKVKYLYKVVRVKTKETPIEYVKKYINYNNDEITLKEIEGYANEFFHKHYDTVYENYLNSYKDDICVQYILETIEEFGGMYKINYCRNYDNYFEMGDDYDSIILEINMSSNYNENIEFIKDNAEEINKCIWTVMKLHPISKPHYKNLEKVNATLTYGNILIIKFKVNGEEK